MAGVLEGGFAAKCSLVLDAASECKSRLLKCFGRQQIKQIREDFFQTVLGAVCHKMSLRLDQRHKGLGIHLITSITVHAKRLKMTYFSRCKLHWSGS